MSTSSRITEAKKEYPGKEENFFTAQEVVNSLECESSEELTRHEDFESREHMEIEVESTKALGYASLTTEMEGSITTGTTPLEVEGEKLVGSLQNGFLDIKCFKDNIPERPFNLSTGPGYDLCIDPNYTFCFSVYREPSLLTPVLKQDEVEVDPDMKMMGKGEIHTSARYSIIGLDYFTPEGEIEYSY